jgi:Mo-co oxidoreductase dimerisation domain
VCAGSSLPASSRLFDCYDGTRKTAISGIAWDGGYGVRLVEISAGNGKTWAEARLGEDLGKYAFRPWSYEFTPKRRGKLALTARATNKIGQTQTQELIQNPAGYNNNVAQTVTLDVS